MTVLPPNVSFGLVLSLSPSLTVQKPLDERHFGQLALASAWSVGTGTFQTMVRRDLRRVRGPLAEIASPLLLLHAVDCRRSRSDAVPPHCPHDESTGSPSGTGACPARMTSGYNLSEDHVRQGRPALVFEGRPVRDVLAVRDLARARSASNVAATTTGSRLPAELAPTITAANTTATHTTEPRRRSAFIPIPPSSPRHAEPAELVIATLQSHGVGTAHRDNHARRPPHRPDIPISSENHTRSVTRHAIRRHR